MSHDRGASGPARGRWPDLFWVWAGAGWQSFGGGTATLALIRRAVVDQRRWVSDEDFTRDWALCQVAPGINLFALAILTGRRVDGWRGTGAALAGLVLPSVGLAILITAFFSRIHRLQIVRHALSGVIPATVGVGIWTSVRLAAPFIAVSWREGGVSLAISLIVLAGSAAVFLALHPPVIAVFLGGAALAAAAGALRRRHVGNEGDAS